MNADKLKMQFKTDGWLLLKNVFSPLEVESFRAIADQIKLENYHGDLLAHPQARRVLTDDRILSIIRSVLGTEDIVYFGDSSCSIGSNVLPGFHKDSPDKFNHKGPDWQSEYTIVRLGIYLQDHAQHSAALSMRNKSHNYPSDKKGKAMYMNTEPGDLVMWYLTTSHSGNSKRLKFAPNFFLPFRLYRFVPNSFFLPEEKERLAFFMTFGKKDHHLERYLRYLKNRRYMVAIWQKSKYTDAAFELMRQKNVTLMNMYQEVKGWDLSKISEKHVELPA